MNSTRTTTSSISEIGMTLFEVLVAVTISSILILALIGLLAKTSEIYSNTNKKIDNLRDGRAAMGMLRRDMASILPATATMPIHYTRDDATLKTQFGFFATLPAGAQDPTLAVGDLCYVLYYTDTATSPDDKNPVSRKLFRKIVSSAVVLPLLAAINPNDLANPANQKFQPPAPDPVNDDVLAFNVLDFRADFRRRDPFTNAWLPASTIEEIQTASEISLTLRVINNEAAAQLPTEAEWMPSNTPSLDAGFDFDSEEDDDRNASSYRARFHLPR